MAILQGKVFLLHLTATVNVNATLVSIYTETLDCPNDLAVCFHKVGEVESSEADRRDLRHAARLFDFRRARADWRIDWLTKKNAPWADKFYKAVNLCAPNSPFMTRDLFE